MKMPYAGSLIRILVVLYTLGAVTTLFLRAHKNSVDRPEYTNNLEASNVTTKIKKTLGPVESKLATERDKLFNVQNAKANQLLLVPAVLRTLNSFREERPSPLSALKNWDALLLKSTGGDAQAKIVVFEAANWCVLQKAELLQMRVSRARGGQVPEKQMNELVQVNDTCKVISEDTSVRRFDFLESAATSGNQEAMVAYEKYLFMAPQNDPDWIWRNSEKVGEMSFKAVGFLEQAAAQGIQEAFDELASIYATGRYGYKDEGRANAYRTQLSKLTLSLEEQRLSSK